ncbi:gluconokinase [Pseudoduganella lutea]|uniref:Gluconokinase n=2 Tax=Pseudoduganella lutea TaxID=321985 RepID=A0A4P6L7L8_9BURK|nr:gluconokinase [Pseudoduganella lutea]
MGVCGCGKSTVGTELANRLGTRFIEGDRFHPAENVAKMSAGFPLDDADRAGWLQALASEIAQARERNEGLVVSCSALKRRYRDLLRQADPGLRFAHLQGPRELIADRLGKRTDHYMPPALLDSQLRDLEPLYDDEGGLRLDIAIPPAKLVERILGQK